MWSLIVAFILSNAGTDHVDIVIWLPVRLPKCAMQSIHIHVQEGSLLTGSRYMRMGSSILTPPVHDALRPTWSVRAKNLPTALAPLQKRTRQRFPHLHAVAAAVVFEEKMASRRR